MFKAGDPIYYNGLPGIFRRSDGRTYLISPIQWPKQTFWVTPNRVTQRMLDT